MNVIVPPRVPPDDEIDGLLRAFYRAQVPHPWPEWKAPAVAPRTVPVRPALLRPALWRSRFALAASVGLLALSSLFLPGKGPREPQSPARPGIGPGSAKRDKVKSSLSLEQPKDGPTKIKVEAYE
ncbi:MAG TPA: hypothetical protein VFE78_33405 [Gemmataceae bacterium]|jgi:hypothetical protein|nr:hypothetical protein [Gemmataceae bacterium]